MNMSSTYIKHLFSTPGIAVLIGIVYLIIKYVMSSEEMDREDLTTLLKDAILISICTGGVLMLKQHCDIPSRSKSKITKDITDKTMGIPDF